MMKFRKIKSVLAISVVALGALSTTVMARDLRIATEGTYAPWSFVDAQGKLTGWDVDIANALCEEMKVKCEIVAQEWDGIIPGLNAKKYDMIVASMTVTEKRKQQVAFSKKYKNTTSQFVAAKGTYPDTSPAALAGKRLGVQRGSSQDTFLTDNYKDSEIVRYDKTTDPEMDLIAGRVDLMIANRVTSMVGFLATPEAANFGLVGQEYSGGVLGEGNAIALRKDDTELLNRVNSALDAIFANGKYDQITSKYFKFKLM
ncbi:MULTISPECIES: transporter substrate-binding domain-containing protein [Rhizobium/Agrobacterium group]|uniref:transporter substrate-binding domain-containing protein n=1 Tax=Rhizobium/Agrobacterium group TaxID=227290 RepID=UPI00179DC583|nr:MULTISPECIES: transporter substrate-binding domain-containing protein [Rhizobium/Agrobacterium group]MBB4403149.1 polar amino acid transport system substrate-binding protein/arginine/ornithine transport system substrate-binding protein [Agrobacterium radiobacter]MBB5588941.1 polar amino acid transport system substrate-binding protein/arginine/ornithine transport system substrate-binding protein [Agrobacterium radiobacter]